MNEIFSARVSSSRLRSRSLIVTLFGDYVSVFSQPVQLSTIVGLLSMFGLKESLIRTTVNRLLKSGWISYVKSGRNSLYSITEEGRERFELFSRRIYQPRLMQFDSDWTILLIEDLSSALLQKLRRQLLWLGFSPINPRSFVHPGSDTSEVKELIDNLSLKDNIIIGSLRLEDSLSRKLVLKQMSKKLRLNTVNNSYRNFIDTYEPLWQQREQLSELKPKLCFQLRLLMIHDYRRILLRDPDLPPQYLPTNWLGGRAQELLIDIYNLVSEPSTQYFAQQIKFDDDNVHQAVVQTVSRFSASSSL